MLLMAVLWLLLFFLKSGEPAAIAKTNSTIGDFTRDSSKSFKTIENEIETIIKSFSKMSLHYFIKNSNSFNVSYPCMSTFVKIFMDLRKLKAPVIKMLDAMSKPPPAILKGALSFMGDYDECLEVKVNRKGELAVSEDEEVYHGQYCIVEVHFPPNFLDSFNDYVQKRVNISTFGKIGKVIEEIPSIQVGGYKFSFKVGVCMPSTCSNEDLQNILGLIPLQFMPMRIKYCDDGKIEYLNVGQILFIIFITLLGTLVVLGTLLEICFYPKSSGMKDNRKKLNEFLLAFSIYGNTKKLMKIEERIMDCQIPAINGMYVIGSLLVIIYHTYFMPFNTDFMNHGTNLGHSMKDWKFTIMSTMGISIDAYFLYSGIFMVYPRYRREGKEMRVNVFKIIIRRYLKFAPFMILIIGIIVSMPLIGSGPVWSEIFGVAAENSRKWWWTYVLMFNNFLAVNEQSFFPLWFIPCLMQITVIGVVLLWFISKNSKFGIILTIGISLACNIVLGKLTYLKNYPLTYAMYYFHKRDHMEITIYTSPLSHVSAYGIGMLLGYFMAKTPILKLSKIQVITGWVLSAFFVVGTQLFCYIGHGGQDLNPILTAVYAATHRTLYSLGMSWMVVACTYGYAGVLGEFLSWKGFGVLAKLSYSGYLIHYIVIAFHVSNTKVSLTFSHYEIFIRFCSYATVSLFASFILYTTFELPMTYIESFSRPRPSNQDKKENPSIQQSCQCVNISIMNGNFTANPNKLESTMWEQQKTPVAENSKL